MAGQFPAHLVWAESYDESSAKRLDLVGLTLCTAAERYVEENLSDLDYPTNINVFVREEGSSIKTLFSVEVIPVPQAYATKVRDPLAS